MKPRGIWPFLVSLLLAVLAGMPGTAIAQDGGTDERLPVVTLDALENEQWSVAQLIVAPGQRIVITNRDVATHTFTVAEWNVDLDLPVLAPVELIVPVAAEPGTTLVFASTANDDRERGMEGTIFVVAPDQILAAARQQRTVSVAVANRTAIRIDDTFTFSPNTVRLAPGALLEVENTGSIEHHFVVDAWQINETISPGEIVLVQVPADARVGDAVEFYCSIPGHKELGMTGTLVIDAAGLEPVARVAESEGRSASVSVDLGAFLPEPATLGDQWTRVRTGTAGAIVSGRGTFNGKVFPGDGIGAAYVGPSGSRVTIVVMPLRVDAVPSEQVKEAIRDVQSSMMQSWTTDNLSAAAMQRIPPPKGCDAAQRVSGIVPVTTLPAGATVCQLRASGIAIFVAVEGGIGETSGVNAADALLTQLLSGEGPVDEGDG